MGIPLVSLLARSPTSQVCLIVMSFTYLSSLPKVEKFLCISMYEAFHDVDLFVGGGLVY